LAGRYRIEKEGLPVRIKICGITGPAAARAATDAGADAIGLNFVGGPRQISPEQAAEILSDLPPLVTPVALVRLERGRLPDDLVELLGEFWVSYVQVYGEITSGSLALLSQDGFRAIPVFAVRDEGFAEDVNALFARVGGRAPSAVVLDAYDPDRAGGTGKAFQWEWVRKAADAGHLTGWPPIVLAGGLTPDNVAEAIRKVKPYAVDVSSGVEVEGRPGAKDPEQMRRFVVNARSAGE
jgi:phosphoribosylanthranilate isomerase